MRAGSSSAWRTRASMGQTPTLATASFLPAHHSPQGSRPLLSCLCSLLAGRKVSRSEQLVLLTQVQTGLLVGPHPEPCESIGLPSHALTIQAGPSGSQARQGGVCSSAFLEAGLATFPAENIVLIKWRGVSFHPVGKRQVVGLVWLFQDRSKPPSLSKWLRWGPRQAMGQASKGWRIPEWRA